MSFISALVLTLEKRAPQVPVGPHPLPQVHRKVSRSSSGTGRRPSPFLRREFCRVFDHLTRISKYDLEDGRRPLCASTSTIRRRANTSIRVSFDLDAAIVIYGAVLASVTQWPTSLRCFPSRRPVVCAVSESQRFDASQLAAKYEPHEHGQPDVDIVREPKRMPSSQQPDEIGSPTSAPSESPSPSVSGQPSPMPSERPSVSGMPSSQPSASPTSTGNPTSTPYESPSVRQDPSSSPSMSPSTSGAPSRQPSEGPSISTETSHATSDSPRSQLIPIWFLPSGRVFPL